MAQVEILEPRLECLPAELISNIAARLGSDSIFSFRLVCRDLETKSLHEFAKEYFSAKCFIFTTESLRCFIDIATSTKLREFLHHVYILPARFPPLTEHFRHCAHRPPVRHVEAYHFYSEDQRRLKNGGFDKQMLAAAFAALPRLTSLTFVDSLSQLPVLVDCRGVNKVPRVTSMQLNAAPPVGSKIDDSYLLWLSHVWRTTIEAFAASHSHSTIDHLETKFTETIDGLSPVMDLEFTDDTLACLSKAFSNLQSVDLSFRLQHLRMGDHLPSAEQIALAEKKTRAFAPLLKSATSFAVRLDVIEPKSGKLCKALLEPFNLQSMQTLKLDGAVVTSKYLGKLLGSIHSIKTLFLAYIDLSSGAWTSILHLIQRLSALDHLHLMWLSEAKSKAYFLEQLDGSGDGMDDSQSFGAPFDAFDDESGDDSEPASSELYGDGLSDEDDELPALVSLGNPANSGTTILPAVSDLGPESTKKAKRNCNKNRKDFKDPSRVDPNRGYYVCIAGEEIQHYLPIFIKEYNTGSLAYDGDPDMPHLNQLFTSLFGGPPIGPGPGPGAGPGPSTMSFTVPLGGPAHTHNHAGPSLFGGLGGAHTMFNTAGTHGSTAGTSASGSLPPTTAPAPQSNAQTAPVTSYTSSPAGGGVSVTADAQHTQSSAQGNWGFNGVDADVWMTDEEISSDEEFEA